MARYKMQISLKPESCIAAALGFLLIPWQWMLAWLASSIFHELCHYIAIRACGQTVLQMDIGPGGAVMKTPPLAPAEELLCAVSGPLGNFLLLTLCHIMPRVAICALFQGLYNLLPVFPMDGGRVLKNLLYLILHDSMAEKVSQTIGNTIHVLLISMLIYMAVWWKMGLLPLLAAAILLRKIKIPCKRRRLRVQ